LRACKRFYDKYGNFEYIDTHGGSGEVVLNGKYIAGSPRIAGALDPSFPCHIVEIDKKRFETLQQSMKAFQNVEVINGDCNMEIDKILEKIPGWKFIFCFIDPSSLVYDEDPKFTCDQLSWETVEKVATSHPKTELFINFPLLAIAREIGAVRNPANEKQRQGLEERLNTFFGNDEWKGISNERRTLLDFFMSRLRNHYEYGGAILILNSSNAPMYYLVYCSHSDIGLKIMKSNMDKEFYQGIKPFSNPYPDNWFVYEG
ncbi:MAG TPA: three-Cys-motif partner protein TcmP, partial [Nitrososphaera sp.]|nr:three-Cys-motif partner protein TcmP [Nitrososphaera sp.]